MLKVSQYLSFSFFAIILVVSGSCLAQDRHADFRTQQISSPRVANAWKKHNEIVKNNFLAHNLSWPAKDLYLRAFKSQNELELWARDHDDSAYRMVKLYKVCAISGVLGPKRQQGDKQVPEGYYFIEEFNPNSDYHLSLQLNYPNFSDLRLAASKPGGDIYIHGGCLTVGCLPMNDDVISEIYVTCLNARLNGQEYIPVHVYPTRLNKNGVSYLKTEFAGNASKLQFWAQLKKGYDYFEANHKLQPVVYSPEGTYLN